MIRVRDLFREDRLVWWLLVIATVIRIGALLDKGVLYDGGFDDATGYMESARVLAATGRLTFYGSSLSAWVMPGFVIYLAVFHLVTTNAFALYLAIKTSILLMSVASIYVLYLLGTRIGGTRVGLISAAFLTFSLPQIYTGTLVLSENPFALSVLVLTVLLIHLADKPGWKVYFWALAVLVASVYTKQAALGLLLPALVYLAVRKYPLALLAKQVAVTSIVLVLALSPWWVRNYRAFGTFVPFTGMGAATVFQGTFQRFEPYRNGSMEAIGELLEGSSESEVERNRILADAAADRMAARWASDRGGMLLAYVVMKPAAAWLLPFYWDKVFGISGYWVLRIHAVLSVLGIALLGWFSFQSRTRAEFLFLLMNVVLISVGAGYYLGLSRYVYPFIPFLYVAVAYAIASGFGGQRFSKLGAKRVGEGRSQHGG